MEISTFKFLFLLCYLFFMYFVGSIIFTKGFLLKRDVIPVNSSCRVDFATYWDGKSHGAEGCWLHRRFDKAVIILIDALRFDFIAPISNAKERPYLNKMKSVHDLIKHKPKNARLYKFTADPPTTTLQRLKGLTTGSLPTFVDAGSNFASAEITEDNFIDQLVRMGKKITFLGDDTWTSLFPGRFNRQYPYPSFNVKDLHTVDNGVLANIYQELRSKDWDVTIGHFLGVDHCGHRYGPNHPAMADKLTQMDDVVRNVTQRLDKNTVLFVLGDHGMTQSGDHGGDSDEELDAAMFVYSPSQITASKYEPGKFDTVSQIDLVPTISLLLGIPIPFSNLGTVVTDLMNHCSWSRDSHIKEVYHSVEALRVNAVQISHYINQYMKTSSDLPPQKLLLLNERLRSAEVQLQTLVTNMFTNSNEENVHQKLHYLENEYKEYMNDVKKLCKEVWAKFDMTSIVLGILILGVTLLLNIYLLYLSSSLYEDRENGTMIIVLILSLVLIVFSIVQSFFLDDGAVNIMAYILGLFDFIALGLIILITRNNLQKSEKKSQETSASFLHKIGKIVKTSIDSSLIIIITFITCLSYFSNSFVVFEDDVSLFLTQTCIWYFFVKVIMKLFKETKLTKDHPKTKSKSVRTELKKFTSQSVILVTILTFACSMFVRISANFQSKREEQMTEEEASGETTQTGAESNRNVTYFFSVACLLVSIYLPRKWLTESGNLNSASISTLCARYLMPVAAIATALYWAMQHLPNKILDALPVWQQVLLPQTVYIILMISLVAIVISPMLVYMLPKQNKQMSVASTQNGKDIFQKVFKYVKSSWEKDTDSNTDTSNDVPKVFGLGTVYSSAIIYNGTLITLLLTLLLGERIAPSVLSAVCAIYCFFELFTISVKLCGESDLLHNGLLTISLMTGSYFYGFGHQATIPAIRFEMAFIGFVGDWENKIIPALLIHCNMFAAEILFTFLVPLLILLPCTRGVIAEHFSFWRDSQGNNWRGDFVMHENQKVFGHLQMKMFFSLYLFQGLKLSSSMIAAAIHKRHLMVWKIFAPRFVYQAMSSFTVFAVSILVTLLLARVNSSLTKWASKIK